MNKIKELTELETIRKELEELEIEKKWNNRKQNETIAIVPPKILLPHFLENFRQLIKQSKEK